MSATKIIGLLLLLIGVGLAYLGLYSSDSLLLFYGSILHFMEHMGLMWSDMEQLPRIYLALGVGLLLIGLLMLLICGSRKSRSAEFF